MIQSASILIVDDGEANREVLTGMIQSLGHQTSAVANGRKAMDAIQHQLPDLIVLDIVMPEMDGYEVLEALQANPDYRHIPVIVVSALDDMDSVVRCIKMGADDYLVKPFNPTLLKARIDASLEKKFLRDREQHYQKMLEQERDKSDKLLRSILPGPIADRLKDADTKIADEFADVTVLFADIVGYTRYAQSVSPSELVDNLNEIFSYFDALTDQYGLEKIKTIGDAYMVVGGLPLPRPDHAEAIADMALAMQERIGHFSGHGNDPFQMRIGINTGPVIAGIIGKKKFLYDLWGVTVNLASRMESSGVDGRIQITPATRERLRGEFELEERGILVVKGVGEIKAWFLNARKSS